jgi:hypothetical protein
MLAQILDFNPNKPKMYAKDNLSLLTAGDKIRDKKRKQNANRPELISFDEDSRR